VTTPTPYEDHRIRATRLKICPADIGAIRRTGTLDKEQLSHAINEIKGCPVSKDELQRLFCRLDLDGHSPPLGPVFILVPVLARRISMPLPDASQFPSQHAPTHAFVLDAACFLCRPLSMRRAV
jgi:hypothetical protein